MYNNIAIVTDSNSGILSSEAKDLGVTVIPMPFYINGDLYLEGTTLGQEDFYRFLESNADVSTSQPSPADILNTWDELLKENDYVVHIPMSSALSGSCETAEMLSRDYEGKVLVVNNRRISITQLQSVRDAATLVRQGKSAIEVKEILEEKQYEASIYLVPDDLDYLKKGGRITPAVASVAKVLNIKPVLEIQGEKLDTFKKVRGMKQAKKVMKEAISNDLNTRFANRPNMRLYVAYAGSKELGDMWQQEIQESFPNYEIEVYPLSLSVSCHTGPGAIGIGCVEAII